MNTFMKQIYAGVIIVSVLVFLTGCQNKFPSETIKISDLQVDSKYKSVIYNESNRIETGEHSFLTIYAAEKIRERESLFYTLAVYDKNDVRHGIYENIEFFTQNSEKSNVSCKVIPNGYVTLEVKRSVEGDEGLIGFSIVFD